MNIDTIAISDYIENVQQRLAQAKTEINNPSMNGERVKLWLTLASLCIERCKKILSENEPDGGDKDGGSESPMA